jgi:signal transduction histidine kinase
MRGANSPLHFFGPIALVSLVLLALGGVGGAVLYQQQAGTADVLNENITSRRAAANFEETLTILIALHRERRANVEPLHQRGANHLAQIMELADKEDEKSLAEKLAASFQRYRHAWDGSDHGPSAHDDALANLQDTLLQCQRLEDYNARQVEESEAVHRRTLRRMAWGLAGVGGVGSLAGLLLGYAVARGLRHSIRQLQIRVQDAAGKLGPDVLAVDLSGDDGFEGLDVRMQTVTRRIEEVVHQLRQREREVLRAEQLAAVGRLAAGVAHEIRNPLTSIKMLVQTAREDGGAAPSAEDLAVIEREVRRLERSLNTFLDFARPARPERTVQDLTVLVNQALDLVRGRAQRQNVALRFNPPLPAVRVSADGDQVQQVLVNLLLNALDAMPKGGTLTVLLLPVRNVVEVHVQDTGPGIATDILPRLFEPFASGKEAGMGLGLVVSRRIAEGHGGSLNGSNRPEGGASFVFRLPIGEPDPVNHSSVRQC